MGSLPAETSAPLSTPSPSVSASNGLAPVAECPEAAAPVAEAAAHRYLTITHNLNYRNWTAHKKTQPTNASMGPSPVWGLMASAVVISSGSTTRVTMYCVGVKDAL